MVNINGEEWVVLLVSPIHPLLRKDYGELALGVCDDPSKTIAINAELDDYLLKKVLCHELTHAAMYSYDIELTYEQEELLAEIISTYGEEIIEITNQLFQRLCKKIRGK